MKGPFTVENLHRRIILAAQQSRGDMDAAVRSVADEIAADPEELRGWWRVLGPWWVDVAQRQMVGREPAPIPDTPLTRPERVVIPRNQRRSRWDLGNPLDLVLPVGGTDEVKRLGDFTRGDLLRTRDYYVRRGRQIVTEGEAWGATAELVAADETLEQAYNRDPDAMRAALPEKVREGLERAAPEAEAAAV